MPLFTKGDKSVLFIHVPKTGGTSIESFFARNGFAADLLDQGGSESLNRFRRCPPQHMHAEQLMSILRPTRCDYVFVVVREPLKRIVSAYRMRVSLSVNPLPPLSVWLDQQFRRYMEDPFVSENHLRPQVEFVLPGCDIIKQEDRFGDDFVRRIEARLQMRFEFRRVGDPKRDAEAAVPAEEIERIRPRVREFYWQDYAAFGYGDDQ